MMTPCRLGSGEGAKVAPNKRPHGQMSGFLSFNRLVDSAPASLTRKLKMTFLFKRFLPLIAISTLLPSALADEVTSFDLVRTSAGTLEARMPYEPSTSVRVGDRLELSSDDGYEFDLNVSKTSLSSLGNRIVHAVTPSGGQALLILGQDSQLLGSISEAGRQYSLFTDEAGRSIVAEDSFDGGHREVDRVPLQRRDITFQAGDALEVNSLDMERVRNSAMRSAPAEGVTYPDYKFDDATISVLIYYDAGLTNVNSVIDYVFEFTNVTFANSELDISFELAGKKQLAGLGSAEEVKDVSDKMFAAEYPFEDIESDRSFYEADLVVAITSGHVGDYCGWVPWLGVYDSSPRRWAYVGAVDWQPDTSQNSFCYRSSFTHEIGHLLGGMHQYSRYDGSVVGAFTYSHAYERAGVFRTIMAPYPSDTPLIGRFSSPDATCEGYTCGVDKQSDNTKTFKATGHLIAGFEGDGFNYALVEAQKVEDDDYECEKDGLEGFWDAPAVRNSSKYDIEMASIHYVRPDGTEAVKEYERGERFINSGRTGFRGWCVTEESKSSLRTTYTQTYARYYHPITDEVVQLESLEWDADYDGEYRAVRVASGQGGSVSGNPTQSVRVGSSQTFNFTPNNGYVISSIQSNCSGRRNGASFTIDVGQDDCFVEATFLTAEDQGELRLFLETPVQRQTYTGIATIQGWAIADEGIDRVDVYIDDSFFQSAPYGGEREDVGGAFPDVDGSTYSGFALTYNYSELSRGEHKIRAEAITSDGRTISRTKTFSVDNFHKPFIRPEDEVNLNSASCTVMNSEISIFDAYIDGRAYDLMLEWRTANQNFQIFDIR